MKGEHHVGRRRRLNNNKQPPSMETLELPEDVFADILIRLPAKQLARMRCVSKPFYAYLSQPWFIKSHLNRNLIPNKHSEILLVLNHSLLYSKVVATAHPSKSPNIQLNHLIKLPPDFPRPTSEWGVVGSVHGLICFICGYDYQCFDIYIWNPSLSAVMRLPPFTCPSTPHEDLGFSFQFDFDPKSDDYKVVKLMSHYVPGWHVEVYSMRKGTWGLISETFPSNVRWIGCANKVTAGSDGHIYWLGLTHHDDNNIVAFDLGNETFYQIPLPDYISRSKGSYKSLGFFDGKLCVTSYSIGVEKHFEMWVMNEHGVTESWVKQYVLSQFTCNNNIHPMGFTLNNEFLFRASIIDPLALYDPDTAKVKYFEDCGAYFQTDIVQYVDSLVWITPAKKHGKTSWLKS